MTVSIEVPKPRRAGLRAVIDALGAARRIALTTHINADGDGAGSQAALTAWLATQGKEIAILNPTPFPETFRHLVDPAHIADPGSEHAGWAAREAELFVVLDTSEPRRIGSIVDVFGDRPVGVIDHHPPGEDVLGEFGVRDPTAAATGELIFDLLRLASGEDEEWPEPIPEAIYTAIVSDTGSFRYANTQPRTHAIAAELLERGVDPEAVYRRLFATMPMRRVRILQAALGELESDPELPLSWITVPRATLEELSASPEDLGGIVEYPRSIEGTEVAVLFRETPDGSTKVSFRSNGETDVNQIAREFGGGGHVKAAGALVNAPLDTAREQVLDAVRAALRTLENVGEAR